MGAHFVGIGCITVTFDPLSVVQSSIFVTAVPLWDSNIYMSHNAGNRIADITFLINLSSFEFVLEFSGKQYYWDVHHHSGSIGNANSYSNMEGSVYNHGRKWFYI